MIFFFITLSYVSHFCFFFSSRRRHTRSLRDWSSDVCPSDLIHQSGISVGRVQGQGQVHRNRGGAASTLGVYQGKDLSSGALLTDPTLSGGKAHERFQQIGRARGAFNELTSPGPHGIYDHLGIREA